MVMRKALSIAAMTIFVFGVIWQFGRWILRWAGYGLGLRSLPPGGYFDFVDSLAAKIASGPSIGWIAGPWLLMSIGLMTLIILRSWTIERNVHSE
jgi:hypothetical protein